MVCVDDNGRVSNYSSDNKYTFLEYLVRKMVRDEVKSVAAEVLTEKRDDIRKAIRKEMTKQSTLDKFYNAFFGTVVDSLDSQFRTKIDINIEKRKDY